MSDKNMMSHMGITDKDIVEFMDVPEVLIGNEDIDFFVSHSVYLGNLEHNDPNSEDLYRDQLEKMMIEISPRIFTDCSFDFEDIAGSTSLVEMREACATIYRTYL